MAESHLRPEQEGQKRRSTRIVQAVPLTVTGVDALGRPFQERTSTLIINCHGARYQSKHYVLKNMWITLEVPHNEPGRGPRTVRGRVTWIQRPRTVRELFQIGVELEVSGNVWGIAFPPGDWFPFPESGSAPTLEIPAPPEIPEAAAEAEDWSTPEAPAVEGPESEPVEDNVRVLPLPAGEDASLQLARQVARLVAEAKQQIQTAARETATHAVAAETRPLLAALQTQLKDAAEKSVAAAVASQLDKSQQETLQRMESEREKGVAAMLAQLSGELDARLSQARQQALASETQPLIAALQAQLKDETEKSVAAAVTAQFEKAQQENQQRMESEREKGMAAMLAQLSGELDARLSQARQQALASETQPLLATLQAQLKDETEKSVAAAVTAQFEKAQQENQQRMESEREKGMAAMLAQLSGELDARLSQARQQALASETQPLLATLQAQLKDETEKSVAAAVTAQFEKAQQENQQRMESEREKGMAAMLAQLSGELDARLSQARQQVFAAETQPLIATLQTQLKDEAEKSVAGAVASQFEKSQQDTLERMAWEREKAMAAMLEQLSGELDLRLSRARVQMDTQLAEVERARRIDFEQQIQNQLQVAFQKLESLSRGMGENHDEVKMVIDQLRESSAQAATEEIRRWQEQMDQRTADAQARLAQMDQAARKLGEQMAAATAIGEVGWRGLLEADLEAASTRWQETMNASVEAASRRTAEQLARSGEAAMREIEQQLQQRINILSDTYSQVTAAAEGVLGTMRTAMGEEAAKGEAVVSQIQDSVAQLEARRSEFSAHLQAATQEWARRSEAMLESQSSELNRRAESAVAGMAQRMQPMLEIAGHDTIEKLASELEQRLAPQISRASEVMSKLAFDGDQAERAAAEHQQRIWQISDRGLQETAARGKELLAQIEKDFGESARTASGRWLTELETRATETSHSTFEALFKSADWYEKKIQTQMQTTLEKGLDQAALRLREKAAEMSGLFASELDHYSRSYVEHAQGQIQENGRETAEHTAQQIAGASEAAAANFTERAAQLGGEQFDLYAAKTKTAFEQNAANMEAHGSQIRSKLESDARGFAVEFQRALSQHAQQTLALGKQELGIQIDQAKDALLIESQTLERNFQSSLNSLGSFAMDEHKQRLENASNSWLLTTVTKLNQQSESLITELADTTEKKLKAICGTVFSEMGETLRQRLATLAAPFAAPFATPTTPASPAPSISPSEETK